MTTGAYAESTPSETGAPVQAEAAAEPQHQLKVTTKYRYFISQYHYIRERKVSYFDNVYAYNHGEYGLTPFASTVPEEYFVADETGTLAIAPIVLDITDAMRERLYGADVGETALYYGQYCQREKDRKGVWGYTGIHEGIDFVNVKGAPLYAILGGEVTRGTDKNGTVAIYNAEYDITLLYLHCENSVVRRGDTVEAGAMIAKEGKKNIKGGDKTHYTHVELRKGPPHLLQPVPRHRADQRLPLRRDAAGAGRGGIRPSADHRRRRDAGAAHARGSRGEGQGRSGIRAASR